MPTYLPSNDWKYSEWINQFNVYLHDNAERLGLTPEQMNALDTLHIRWDADYEAHKNAHAAARVATCTKDTTRRAMDEMVRAYGKIIQACPSTTNADRTALGLTIPGTGSYGPEISYKGKPQPNIDIREHLVHNIKVSTWTPDGVKKAKPAGVMGCEVRRAIGTAPASAEDMEVVGVMPGTKFSIEYPGSEAGKLVTYAMRWISTSGEPGAWSNFVTATIAA